MPVLGGSVRKIISDLAISGDLTAPQIGANQNDYNPAGLAGATVLRISSDASRNITGLAGGFDGRVLILHNVGANNINLLDESGSSSAANRFAFAGSSGVGLNPDEACILQYDATAQRWKGISRPPPTHALLGGTHNDAVTQAPSRGSLITGNSTPAWDELILNTASKHLRSDGSDALWSWHKVATKTTTATLTDDEEVIIINASTVFTITLPPVSGRAGKWYRLIKKDVGYPTQIDADGAETINGKANFYIEHKWEIIDLFCDGTEWYAIWVKPDTPTDTYFHVFDDFFGVSNESGEISTLHWNERENGTAAETTLAAPDNNHIGIIDITTASTSGNDASLDLTSSGGTSNLPLDHDMNYDITYLIRLPDVTSITVRIGLFATTTFDSFESTNGVAAFLFDPATSAKWRMRTRNTGDQSTTDSGADVAANTWYKLKILKDGANIRFFINNVHVASHGTEVPTQTCVPAMGVQTNASATKTLQADYFELIINGVSR